MSSKLKKLIINGEVRVISHISRHYDGLLIDSIESLTIESGLENFSIPSPENREIINYSIFDYGFYSVTIGKYPNIDEFEIICYLEDNHFLAYVTEESITIFFLDQRNINAFNDFFKKANFRLSNTGKLFFN